MKIKTVDLTGAALDWAVAKCEGKPSWMMGFSTEWEKGGPIIERERINIRDDGGDQWAADDSIRAAAYGPTPLIAAMRCYVASKLGDEVEVPEELK
jgi:hypothetical protein